MNTSRAHAAQRRFVPAARAAVAAPHAAQCRAPPAPRTCCRTMSRPYAASAASARPSAPAGPALRAPHAASTSTNAAPAGTRCAAAASAASQSTAKTGTGGHAARSRPRNAALSSARLLGSARAAVSGTRTRAPGGATHTCAPVAGLLNRSAVARASAASAASAASSSRSPASRSSATPQKYGAAAAALLMHSGVSVIVLSLVHSFSHSVNHVAYRVSSRQHSLLFVCFKIPDLQTTHARKGKERKNSKTGKRREGTTACEGEAMARPDPENVYLDLDSLVLERQMPLILQDCVSRDTLEKEVC